MRFDCSTATRQYRVCYTAVPEHLEKLPATTTSAQSPVLRKSTKHREIAARYADQRSTPRNAPKCSRRKLPVAYQSVRSNTGNVQRKHVVYPKHTLPGTQKAATSAEICIMSLPSSNMLDTGHLVYLSPKEITGTPMTTQGCGSPIAMWI